MEEEIRALRQKAEALNAPSTFVQSAKLARKARALEKELEAKRQKEQSRSNAISRAVAWFKYVTIFLAVVLRWGRPLVVMHEEVDLWPLDKVLRWPDLAANPDGTNQVVVSTLAACLLVERVLAYVLRP